MNQREIVDDLDRLLEVLPSPVRQEVVKMGDRQDLLEIVLDLGRQPEVRLPTEFRSLNLDAVTREDIDYVLKRVGHFGSDNRAGIERTLHRISAIRNRRGDVVGLTCRIGRAVFGTIDIIRDVVEEGQSFLLLGRPGVGKTTMLREVARVLADELDKRVIIVDTSNEIAGDGDIPHPAIGRARRMQVAHPDQQAAVMIEAVENHMPEVIVIDEIGTEKEAAAARTIAERGVQLIGTAHGTTLENLMANPTLVDLLGGLQAVTLGDEEARKRGSQKTVLERKAPPTFEVVVEIRGRNLLVVHRNVASTVDALLRGAMALPEVRMRDDKGKITITPGSEPSLPAVQKVNYRLFPYGVSRNRIEKAISNTGAAVTLTGDLRDADLVLTLKGQYRKMPKGLREAEQRGLPIEIIRSNTVTQIEGFLAQLMGRD